VGAQVFPDIVGRPVAERAVFPQAPGFVAFRLGDRRARLGLLPAQPRDPRALAAQRPLEGLVLRTAQQALRCSRPVKKPSAPNSRTCASTESGHGAKTSISTRYSARTALDQFVRLARQPSGGRA
jgi:hypothetical protein